jgi:2-keto-3-deoxy-6-phosphogluconate aldolase
VNEEPVRAKPTAPCPCLELTVNSAVAESVLELIKARFGQVTTRAILGAGTTLTVTGIDPSGQRALLNLLWDTGHEIRSMSST